MLKKRKKYIWKYVNMYKNMKLSFRGGCSPEDIFDYDEANSIWNNAAGAVRIRSSSAANVRIWIHPAFLVSNRKSKKEIRGGDFR